MYGLKLRKHFIAQHFLIGKDFGCENLLHSHHYRFELEIENHKLDEFNYLIDIVDVRRGIDALISYFQDKILNELPEFTSQNPSIELFSKILWHKLHEKVALPTSSKMTIRLWEDEIAEASYRQEACA